MSVKRTPGPWRAEEWPNHVIGFIDDGLEILSETRNEIALVPIDDSDEDAALETVGNAHLIAAAPELLDMVREFIRLRAEQMSIPGALECGDPGCKYCVAFDRARALVAKAEGGAP